MTLESGQDIAQRIAAGDLDDSIGAIYEAMQTRFKEQAVGLTWSINLPALDIVITEDDLTIDEAMLIERMAGCTWGDIDPVRSANDARAVLAACLSQRQNLTPEQATERLKSVRVTDYLRAIKREVLAPAPLDSAA